MATGKSHGKFVKSNLVFIFYCSILINTACRPHQKATRPYSFFVAGHTYGCPTLEQDTTLNTLGFHTPFQKKFKSIKNSREIKFGVLTGDLVWLCTPKEWDAVDSDISKIGKKVYIAAGNHDINNPSLFKSRYGKTYFSFMRGRDLFIILDPNLSGWKIDGGQLEFLRKTLSDQAGRASNIFVFFHQLLWWTPDNAFKSVEPNSTAGRSAEINFWSDVEPMFHKLPNKIYMFAGDVGAFPGYRSVAYHHYDNITFIASGMGGGLTDNFIIVKLDRAKNVHFKLVSLNSDSEDALGQLEDHKFH